MRTAIIFLLLLPVLPVMAQAVRNDVVIGEIMADPFPPAGLPDLEYLELKNVSGKPVNLSGWKISDATASASISGNIVVQPDSFVVLCSNSAAARLSAYGRTVGVGSFPSLDNDGEVLALTSREGKLIHAVEYHKSWYGNAVKSEGGWSLEMIDTHSPCSGAGNWMASASPNGGTPGRKNAADGQNKDLSPPVLLQAYAPDSLSLMLIFSEPLDSAAAASTGAYAISDGIGPPAAASVLVPLFSKVRLRLNHVLQPNKVYGVSVHSLGDCSGNTVKDGSSVKAGWASGAEPGDAVISEILFNPKPDGTDYVEIYNRSDRIIDAKDLYIANRSAGGSIGQLRQLSTESSLLFPQDYLVITESAGTVQRQYLARDPGAFAEVSAMPSLPDDKGTVLLLNAAGTIVDELRYEDKWHFALLDNTEGIALERMSYAKPTQDRQNWHSAAAGAGWGTPGYRNSQFRPETAPQGTVSISPVVFSPDNDGHDDVATVVYQFSEPGYVCNITLFNSNGRPVRFLARNVLCGLKGYFTWDGLDEKGTRLDLGIYILLMETFNLQGATQRYRHTLVIARKLQ